jgi:hypothetical protein
MMELALIALLLTVVVALAYFRRRPELPKEGFLSLKKPTLWWFVDVEPNSRNWDDFGARKTMRPNRGYLQVALDALQRSQGKDFLIIPLIGRQAVCDALGPDCNHAATQLPAALWRQWALCNLLSAHGGLAMDGASTLCIGPSFKPFLNGVDAAMFGVNPDEPMVSPATASAPGPGPYAGWAASSRHDAWKYAADTWNALVLRGPQAWSAAAARRMPQAVWEGQRSRGARVLRTVEACRLKDGRPLELEDLFGRIALPVDMNAVYISYDGDMLARRHEFSWFLRMSPEQLADSQIAWARIAGL